MNVLPDFTVKADVVIANEYAFERFFGGLVLELRIDRRRIAIVFEFGLRPRATPWTRDSMHDQ